MNKETTMEETWIKNQCEQRKCVNNMNKDKWVKEMSKEKPE